jgi:hypothetical protein
MAELTPASVMNTLAVIGKEIDTETEKLKAADWAEREARRNFRRANALAILANKIDSMTGKPYPVIEREALAYLATEEEMTAHDIAEYNLQAIKDELKALRDRLEIGRSMSPIMRMEFTGRD